MAEIVSSFLTKNLELTTKNCKIARRIKWGTEILPSRESPACPDLVGVARLMTRRTCRLFVGRFAFADAALTAFALLEFKQCLHHPRASAVRPNHSHDENPP